MQATARPTAKKNAGVRLDNEMRSRLERIARELSKRANGADITLSDALRQAVERGIPLIEKQLGLKASS
jgi:predicted transcriptional regulator